MREAKHVSLFLDFSYIKFTSQNISNIIISIIFQIVIVTIDMCIVALVFSGGGVTFTKFVRGCALPDLGRPISIPIFLPNFPPIIIPFLKEKHPILTKLGAFYNNLPKNTPNLCNLGSFVFNKNLPIAIPNFAKKAPQKGRHIRIPCQCENPPPPPEFS